MRQPEPEKVAAGSPERIIVQTATFLPEDCPLKITNKTIAMYKRLVTILAVLFCGLMASAQDVKEVHQLNYDPEKLKIIPDKVFEFGIPLLFVFLLIYGALVSGVKPASAYPFLLLLGFLLGFIESFEVPHHPLAVRAIGDSVEGIPRGLPMYFDRDLAEANLHRKLQVQPGAVRGSGHPSASTRPSREAAPPARATRA